MSNENPTSPPVTTASGTDPSTHGTGTSGNTGVRRSNNRQNNQAFPLSNPVSFEGDIRDIGAVIGLKIDKFHKNLSSELKKDGIDIDLPDIVLIGSEDSDSTMFTVANELLRVGYVGVAVVVGGFKGLGFEHSCVKM